MVARDLLVDTEVRRESVRWAQRHHYQAHELHADPVVLPIGLEQVYAVASKGFPVWEPIHVLQLRNRRITVAYSNVSAQLAELTAGDHRLNANWCTFATWSSKTIGNAISHKPDAELLATTLAHWPQSLREPTVAVAEHLLSSGHGAMFRSLALGNRFVFLEIATAVTGIIRFLRGSGPHDEDTFEAFWQEILARIRRYRELDPSWVPPRSTDPLPLREGLRAYVHARQASDEKSRAELVLIGNIYLAAYEQRRVQAYVGTALSMFTALALRRVVQGRSSRFGPLIVQRISWLYAAANTRYFLTLNLPTADLRVGRPVPSPRPDDRDEGHLLFPPDLEWIEHPVLQALLTRYDLSDGRAGGTRARNWIRYGDRMNYIVNLFRAYQQQQSLFDKPFDEAVEQELLDGNLPREAAGRSPIS